MAGHDAARRLDDHRSKAARPGDQAAARSVQDCVGACLPFEPHAEASRRDRLAAITKLQRVHGSSAATRHRPCGGVLFVLDEDRRAGRRSHFGEVLDIARPAGRRRLEDVFVPVPVERSPVVERVVLRGHGDGCGVAWFESPAASVEELPLGTPKLERVPVLRPRRSAAGEAVRIDDPPSRSTAFETAQAEVPSQTEPAPFSVLARVPKS